jgi:hypothetical protein
MPCSQKAAPPCRKPATVCGSSSSDEAKIGGMTPEVLSFSGRCEVALEHAVADLALRILDQQAALRAFEEDDQAITPTAMTTTA